MEGEWANARIMCLRTGKDVAEGSIQALPERVRLVQVKRLTYGRA